MDDELTDFPAGSRLGPFVNLSPTSPLFSIFSSDR